MLTKVEWVLVQPLASPLTCIGDGHDGIWNIIKQMAPADQRLEILDWYHLKENLYKVGGSLKRLRQAEAFLWRGQVDSTLELFRNCSLKQAHNFCQYLDKHRHRVVNYEYFQAEQICSIGSGAVESSVKQIDRRNANFRRTVEAGKCPTGVGSSVCLPQWSNYCLNNLQR